MPTTTGNTMLLDEQAPFDEFCSALAKRGPGTAIACDTEFARTNTYWPTLCLVQVELGGDIVCLDVLAVSDLSVFERGLAADNGPWIMHAAKQDLEAMHSTFAVVPSRIIDTQIAAGLLGHAPQIGYANLVEELLGIRLAKGETRTDWSRRPLTPAQLAYAADDVAHLPAIHELLTEGLRAAGRLDWADEDCAALLVTDQYESQPALAWQRLPRIQYLPVAVQARARRLATWRETRATSRNRPRKWILADKPLLQIAHANPASTADLAQIRDLPPAVIRNSADALIEECRQANADVANGDIDFSQQAKPAAPEENALKKLSKIVRATAEELQLAPELLATRKELNGMLRGQRDMRSLSGWRKKVIGERLLEAL